MEYFSMLSSEDKILSLTTHQGIS